MANSVQGCSQWGDVCGVQDGQQFCGLHGECYAEEGTGGAGQFTAKCVCDPGWGGPRCDRKLEYMEFFANGFVQYELLPNVFSEYETNMDLLIVPGFPTSAPLAYAESTGRVSSVLSL